MRTEKGRKKMSESRRGRVAWNKGLKTGLIPSTAFKKGQIAVNKGKTFEQDSEHWNWKGDKVGYSGLHRWKQKHDGRASSCEHCGKIGDYEVRVRSNKEIKVWNIHWANKSQKYLRDLKDWLALCVQCHRNYDYGTTNSNT